VDTVTSLPRATATIHYRSFHRHEYSGGTTSLIILLNLVVIVRFGANIYLLFYLYGGGTGIDFLQVFGGFFLCATIYFLSTAPIQGFKINRFLWRSASVFQTGSGKKLLLRIRSRIVLSRPVGFSLFVILLGVLVIVSFVFDSKQAAGIWLDFAVACVCSLGGYLFLVYLSYRLELSEFDARLIEIILLISLALSNPDFVPGQDAIHLGFFLYRLPLDRFPFYLSFVIGGIAAGSVLMFLFRIGSRVVSLSRKIAAAENRTVTNEKSRVMVRLYFKFIKLKYWIILYFISYAIIINYHLQAKAKMNTLLGFLGVAVFSFTIFLFSLDAMTREQWGLKVLERERVVIFTAPILIHVLLSGLPLLFYIVAR